MRSYLFLAASVVAAVLLGCPNDEGETCSDYEPPPTFDAQSPPVAFSRDVMPIFKASCAFTSCHGLQGSSNGVFLGESAGPGRVHAGLVDVRSSHLPTMAIVAPGNPRESFMMRKVDGSQCVLDPQCIDRDCGDSMPRREEMLPLDARDTLRRWIAQGAKND